MSHKPFSVYKEWTELQRSMWEFRQWRDVPKCGDVDSSDDDESNVEEDGDKYDSGIWNYQVSQKYTASIKSPKDLLDLISNACGSLECNNQCTSEKYCL